METERPQIEREEIPEPGKPLRPYPGSPETRGGSMDSSADKHEPEARLTYDESKEERQAVYRRLAE